MKRIVSSAFFISLPQATYRIVRYIAFALQIYRVVTNNISRERSEHIFPLRRLRRHLSQRARLILKGSPSGRAPALAGERVKSGTDKSVPYNLILTLCVGFNLATKTNPLSVPIARIMGFHFSLFISEATSLFILHLKIRSRLMNNE